MAFALIQTRLEIPPVEALRRAFAGFEGLHPTDAPHLAQDAFGILVKGLSEAHARELQTLLAAEGVQTEVCRQRDLPEPPPSKQVRRADLAPEGLVAFDPLDRPFVVPWAAVRLAAAGWVRVSEFESRSISIPGGPRRGLAQFEPELTAGDRLLGAALEQTEFTRSVHRVTREERRWRLLVDLVIAGGQLRFNLQGHEFVGARAELNPTQVPAMNLVHLVQQVLPRLEHAALNRGAFAIRQGEGEIPRYPTRNAYMEEMIWILHRLRQAEAGDAGAAAA